MPSGRRSSKRPYVQGHMPLDVGRLAAIPRSERGPGGAEFTVRRGANASKTYTCPGCHRPIVPGTNHVVAWSNEHLFGVDAGLEERRHWHTACWQRAAR